MVAARDLKSLDSNIVRVRFPPPAHGRVIESRKRDGAEAGLEANSAEFD